MFFFPRGIPRTFLTTHVDSPTKLNIAPERRWSGHELPWLAAGSTVDPNFPPITMERKPAVNALGPTPPERFDWWCPCGFGEIIRLMEKNNLQLLKLIGSLSIYPIIVYTGFYTCQGDADFLHINGIRWWTNQQMFRIPSLGWHMMGMVQKQPSNPP